MELGIISEALRDFFFGGWGDPSGCGVGVCDVVIWCIYCVRDMDCLMDGQCDGDRVEARDHTREARRSVTRVLHSRLGFIRVLEVVFPVPAGVAELLPS